MKLSAAIVAVFLLPAGAFPQHPMPKDNRYEVVSIKSSAPSETLSFLPQGLQTTFRAFSLKTLISYAFLVREPDLIGLPKWAESEKFTIVAKAKAPVQDNADWYTMLQSVFLERFALKYHMEKRPTPVYLVTAAPGGIRLPISAPGSCVMTNPGGGPPPPPTGDGRGGMQPCGYALIVGVPPDGLRLKVKGTPMSRILGNLQPSFDRPLVDRTGSDQKYDVDISYLRNLPAAAVGATEAADSSGLPTITAALKKVGILVTPKTDAVDVIVIDRLEKPSGN
jgi:uncharacterized protein (TIGR03435 family)